jgi:hydrogenase maturation protease
MARSIIIGYGNPLRGDDGVGWHAARRLEAVLQETEIIACHQLTPELAEPMSWAEIVVFVDADAQGPAGSVSCQTVTPGDSGASALSHHVTPRQLLGWTQSLWGASPQAFLFSVSGQSFGCGEELSVPVGAALPELIERIGSLIGAEKTWVRRPSNG